MAGLKLFNFGCRGAESAAAKVPVIASEASGVKRAGWWHFQYTADLERSWLDEMEAIGINEATLVEKGWTLSAMDRRPR